MQFLTYEEYQTLSELKKPTLDNVTKQYIDAANAHITAWLNWDDSTSQVIRVISTRDTYFLDNVQASAILSVNRYGTTDNPIDPSNYYLQKPGQLVFINIPSNGVYTVEVVPSDITGSTVGKDLKTAAILLVNYWSKNEYRNSKTFGGETVTFTTQSTGMPKHIRTILELYRNI